MEEELKTILLTHNNSKSKEEAIALIESKGATLLEEKNGTIEFDARYLVIDLLDFEDMFFAKYPDSSTEISDSVDMEDEDFAEEQLLEIIL